MIKHITIIGQGAIGSLWAYYLDKAGLKVTLVGRARLARVMTLTVTLPQGDIAQIELDYLSQQLPERNDLVLVTTKAYQVRQALGPVLAQLTSTPVILLHNGMGSVEQLALKPSQPVLLATTSHGALKTADHAIAHTGLGQTFIGRYQGITAVKGKKIAQLLNQALPRVEYCDDIERALWQKLAINCAINPLTAIEQCRNGQLTKAKYKTTIDGVCNEISQITAKLQLDLSFDVIRQGVDDVITNTANNYSSMYQDIANKRPTEIEFITGYVVRQAERLGLTAPQNNQLWLKIKALEKSD